MKTFFTGLTFGLMVAVSLPALTQWSDDPTVNVPISRAKNQEQHPLIVSDGADGAIMVWESYSTTFGYDLKAQRVDAGGTVLWSTVDICTALRDQKDFSVASDGAGGAIITWTDQRDPTPEYDIYAQRVDASGNVKWTVDGIAICTATNVQAYPKIVSDGAGGAIITWRDSRNYSTSGVDIYAQRVNASGSAQWTAGGAPICTSTGDQMDPRIVSDGSGGAIIAWTDNRDATTGWDVYAQQVNASGVTQWTANGVGYKANGNQEWPSIASDGAGGAVIAWQDDYMGTADLDIRALRVGASGNFPWASSTTPASRWISGATGNQTGPHVVSDGSGGAIIAWTDYRNGTANSDIYAQRVDASGTEQWTGWGEAICNASDRQESPAIVSDAFSGAIITWHDRRYFGTMGVDIYAQRVDAFGKVQWTSDGIEVSSASKHQQTPAIVRAGTCGAIIVWVDQRWVGDPYNDTDWDIYAQRVFCDGSLALHTITVDVPNGGESWQAGTSHNITWHGQGIDNYDVKIEYSTDNGATYNFITYKTNLGTSGSYAWDVPNTPSTQCLVRLTVLIPPAISDVSDKPFTILASAGYNTPVGTNVTVNLGSGVVVTFDQVTGAGNTTVNVKTSGPAPPGGFTIVPSGSPIYYDITTTATYTGNIKVCIQYNDTGMTPQQEAGLKLQLYESPPGQWKDVTTSLDVNANIVCGTVTHFSTFAVMMPVGAAESITVISPNGNENWPVGSQQEIKWTSANLTTPVRIEYSTTSGASYTTIVASTPNTGSYVWTIPNTPSTLCAVKILDAVDGDPWDISDAEFSIVAAPIHGPIIVNNTFDSGPGSLREAILQANTNPGMDTIFFNIPQGVPGYDADVGVWTIRPASALPVISDEGLIIDGRSQAEFIRKDTNPHGPEIQLDGTDAGASARGLKATANWIQIYSLIINRFKNAGIEMNGVGGGRISGCYLGTDFAGLSTAGNQYGIWLHSKTHGVHIAPLDTLPNVISGNTGAGVFMSDSSHHNIVLGNFIGPYRPFDSAAGNGIQGIVIQDQSDSNEVVDNRIFRNGYGVYIGSDGNMVANNWIGTNPAWEPFGNQNDGVVIWNEAQNNLVIENLIGHNGGHGVLVQGAATIRNRITRNHISFNAGSGIRNLSGGNTELAPPKILTASANHVTGTAGPEQKVEVFADEGDEGLIFLGETMAEASGNFDLLLPNPLPPMPHVTATATDAAGNTSEFCSPFLITTVAEKTDLQTPKEFALSQNYPNPFNPGTVIQYALPQKIHVVLRIIDLAGAEVLTLVDEDQNLGHYAVNWNGTDKNGRRVASGIYLCNMQTKEFIKTRKIVLIR